jgi:hypothetical protein
LYLRRLDLEGLGLLLRERLRNSICNQRLNGWVVRIKIHMKYIALKN